MALVRENDIRPEDIEEVIIGIDNAGIQYCQPESLRHYPRNAVDLQFSIPYNVSNAIIHRKVGFEHYTDEALKNRKVLDFLATKVRSWVDPEVCFDALNKSCPAARLQIKTKDGKVYVKRVDHAKGSQHNPMGMKEIIEKFWICTELLAKPIPRENLEKALDLAVNLEKVADVTAIPKLLA